MIINQNISNDLIIKGLDNQSGYQSPTLCLIIKGLDSQAQKLNNQINQYPPKPQKILTGSLETKENASTFQSPSTSLTVGLTDSL